ncbi:MAG TPA: hypothetical protein VGL94_18120 [Ktedonobacteraceae bacterium]|jgi:hypothetical protein
MATNAKSVEKVETILQNLKAEAKKAHDEEDVFLMSVLTDMIKLVSPVVTKAIARQHRETNAKINKAHKKLREKAAKERATAKENPSEEAPDLSDI